MDDWDPHGPPVASGLQLKVSLNDFEPVIWRRVLVADSITNARGTPEVKISKSFEVDK